MTSTTINRATHSEGLAQLAASFLPITLLPVALFALCIRRPKPKLLSSESLVFCAMGLLGISGALGFSAVSEGGGKEKEEASGWVGLVGVVALYAFLGPILSFNPRLVPSGRAEGKTVFLLTLGYFALVCTTILAKALVLGVEPTYRGTTSINGFCVAEGVTTLVLEAFLLICSLRLGYQLRSKLPQAKLPPSPKSFKPLSLPLKFADQQASHSFSDPEEVGSGWRAVKRQVFKVLRAPFVVAQGIAVSASMVSVVLAVKAQASKTVLAKSGLANLALAVLLVVRVVITLAQGLCISSGANNEVVLPARQSHLVHKFFGNYNGSTFSNFRWPSLNSSSSKSVEVHTSARRWSAPPRLQLTPSVQKDSTQPIGTSTPPRRGGGKQLNYFPKPLARSIRSHTPLLDAETSPSSTRGSVRQHSTHENLSPTPSSRNSSASSGSWWRRSGFSDRHTAGRTRSKSNEEGPVARTSLDASAYRQSRKSLSVEKRRTLSLIDEVEEEKAIEGRPQASGAQWSEEEEWVSAHMAMEASNTMENSSDLLSLRPFRRGDRPSSLTLHSNASSIGLAIFGAAEGDIGKDEIPTSRATPFASAASSIVDLHRQLSYENSCALKESNSNPSTPSYLKTSFGEGKAVLSPPFSSMPGIYVTAPTLGGAVSRPSTGSLSLLSVKKNKFAIKRASQESFECAGPSTDFLGGASSSGEREPTFEEELPTTEASPMSVLRNYINRVRRPSVCSAGSDRPVEISLLPLPTLRSVSSPIVTSTPVEEGFSPKSSGRRSSLPSGRTSLSSQSRWSGVSNGSGSGSGGRVGRARQGMQSDDSGEWEPFSLELGEEGSRAALGSKGLGLAFNGEGSVDVEDRLPRSPALSMSAFLGRRPRLNRDRPSEITISNNYARNLDESKGLLDGGVTPPLTPATPLTWPSPPSEGSVAESPTVPTHLSIPFPEKRGPDSVRSDSSVYSQDDGHEQGEVWPMEDDSTVVLSGGKSRVVALGSKREGGSGGPIRKKSGMW